jgi:hypothetical protein
VPIIDPDPDNPEEAAAHTLCVQISKADFDNKSVGKMLRCLAVHHITNRTGKLDWVLGADSGVGTIASVNGQVFVDTIICQFFVAEYHTKLVRRDQAPIEDDDDPPLDHDGTHWRVLTSEVAQYARTEIHAALQRFGLVLTTTRDVQLKNGLRELGAPHQNMKATFKRHESATAAATEAGLDEPEEPADVGLERHNMRATQAILDRIRSEGAAMRSNQHLERPPLKVINRRVTWETSSTKFYSNKIKIASKNEKAEPVIQAIRAGALADLGIYHLELDTSTDCSGCIKKFEVADDLVEDNGYRYQTSFEGAGYGCAADPSSYDESFEGRINGGDAGCILDNSRFVGNNCLSIMRTSQVKFGPDPVGNYIHYQQWVMPEKMKIYNKYVANLEHKAVAAEFGWHGMDNATLMFEREARTMVLPETQKRGESRAENTVFTRGVEPDVAHLYTHSSVETARKTLLQTCALARQELCYDQPLAKQWEIYCENAKHILIVVHSRYDRAVIVYSINEVTGKTPGMHINRWSKVYRYILERCSFGKVPTDIVTIHTGRDVPMRRAKQARKKRKSRAMPPEEKKRRKEERKRQKLNTHDIRSCFSAAASSSQPTAEGAPTDVGGDDNDDNDSDSDSSSSSSESGDEGDTAVEPQEEIDTCTQSTAEEEDCARYDYKAGWVPPEDPEGAAITSLRVFRAPLKKADISADGGYFPETRLCQDTPGTCFKPDGKLSKELYSGRPGQEPFALPAGYNDDSTHIDDVGDKSARGRRVDTVVAVERQANGGMAPNKFCNLVTFPPLKPVHKPRFCHIIASCMQLPIVVNAALNNRALGELPPEAAQDRADRLRSSLDNAPAERAAILMEQRHFLDSDAYKTDVLHADGRKVVALDTLPIGDHQLVAVELRAFSANKFQRPHSLIYYTTTADGSTITAFASRKAFDKAFFDCRALLAPLFNAKGAKGKIMCYMHQGANGGSIGTLSRSHNDALDRHGRTFFALDVVLSLPDGTQVSVIENGEPGADAKRAAQPEEQEAQTPDSTEAEPMDAEDAAGGTEIVALPTIERPARCPSSEFQPLHTLLVPVDKTSGAVVTVLRMGSAIQFNQGSWLPMEVRIEAPHVRAGVCTAMSRAAIHDAAASINANNNTAFVYGVTKRGEQADVVSPEDVWWQAAHRNKNAYKALPQIAHQMASPPANTTIVAAKLVPNFRRDKKVFIVKMADDTVYSFTAPQTIAPFKLKESNSLNVHLDTAAWTATPL